MGNADSRPLSPEETSTSIARPKDKNQSGNGGGGNATAPNTDDDDSSEKRQDRTRRNKGGDNHRESRVTANNNNSKKSADEQINVNMAMADLMAYLQVVANNSNNLPLTVRDDPELDQVVSTLTPEDYARKSAAFVPADVRIIGGTFTRYGRVWDLPTTQVSLVMFRKKWLEEVHMVRGTHMMFIFLYVSSAVFSSSSRSTMHAMAHTNRVVRTVARAATPCSR
jgi:hypothetical protein